MLDYQLGEPAIRAACPPRRVSAWSAFLMHFLPLFTGIRHLAHVLTVPPTKACLLYATPAAMDLYIQAMPLGTYRVQSPRFPKIVYWATRAARMHSTKITLRILIILRLQEFLPLKRLCFMSHNNYNDVILTPDSNPFLLTGFWLPETCNTIFVVHQFLCDKL